MTERNIKPCCGVLLRAVVTGYNLQFFSELITTQLRISHGVTANSVYSRENVVTSDAAPVPIECLFNMEELNISF